MLPAMNVSRFWPVLVLLITLISLTSCGGIDARKAKYFSRGLDYYKSENYEKARVEFSNVLKIDQKHLQANYELARTFERLNKVREAGGFYLRVIELDPKNYQAMVRLGRIYLLGRAVNEAKSTDEQALAIAPRDPGAIALRGGIHAFLGDVDTAFADANLALQLDPNNIDAIALLAGLQLRKQNFQEAARIVALGVQTDPRDSQLRQLLAGIYVKLQQPDKAIAVLKEIITLQPGKLSNYSQLAEFYLANKSPHEAEQVAIDAVTKLSDDTDAKILHIEVINRSGETQRAETQLKKYISENSDDYALRLRLSGLYASANRTQESVTTLEKMIKDDGKGKYGLIARNALAKYYLSSNDITKGEKLINEVLEESPQDNDALIMRGSLALSKKDYSTAIGDLRAALRNQPNQAALLRQLAEAHYGNGENELAKQTYETALTAEPQDASLYLEYAEFLQNSGDSAQAIKVIDNALSIAPDDLRILEAKLNLYLARKEGKAALPVAEKIKSLAKDKIVGYYAAGLAYQLQNEYKTAQLEFNKALLIDPESPALLTACARNLISMNKTDGAIQFLKEKVQKNPKNAVAHNLLGEIYLSQKKLDDALQAFELAQQSQPEWATPYRNQALVFLQSNKLEEGIKAYQRGYEQTKGDPALGYALASLYSQTNRADEAIQQLESLLQKSPASDIARNNLAMMLVTYRTDKTSIIKAMQLVEPLKKSVNPNYLDTIGWVLYKNGEVKESIPYLRKARDKAGDASVINYHLGMALLKAGDKPAAKPLLEAVVKSPRPFAGMEEAKEALQQL
ncbi:MAG: tetratricopeptide repeat protein [Gammaproteobacteria bacterium]|nr:tetratricopeptide repeat protein [Gammaproteobacteria bacterium]